MDVTKKHIHWSLWSVGQQLKSDSGVVCLLGKTACVINYAGNLGKYRVNSVEAIRHWSLGGLSSHCGPCGNIPCSQILLENCTPKMLVGITTLCFR